MNRKVLAVALSKLIEPREREIKTRFSTRNSIRACEKIFYARFKVKIEKNMRKDVMERKKYRSLADNLKE